MIPSYPILPSPAAGFVEPTGIAGRQLYVPSKELYTFLTEQRRWEKDSGLELGNFGARGDLSKNDAPALKSALEYAAGRPIHAPLGRYRIDEPVVYDGPWNIWGDGNGCGILDVAGDLSAVVSNDNCTQFVKNFEAGDVFSSTTLMPSIFRDFQINTTEGITPTSGAGIMFSGPAGAGPLGTFQHGTRILNVGFANQYDCIEAVRPYAPLIAGCFGTSWVHAGCYYRTTSGTEGNGGNNCHNFWFGNSGSTSQVACVLTETGYIDIHNNTLLGSLAGVYAGIKNGAAGSVRARNNSIENSGSYGIVAFSQDGSAATMMDFSGNEFSNVAVTSNWSASIEVLDYNTGTDWLTDLRISNNVHRHSLVTAGRFIWVASGQNVLIQNEQMENLGAVPVTYGIDVSSLTHGAVKSQFHILDCQFKGSFSSKYRGSANAVIRDLNGMAFADLPTCADGSQIYVTDGRNTSSSDPTLRNGGAGGMAFRNGAAWQTLQPN